MVSLNDVEWFDQPDETNDPSSYPIIAVETLSDRNATVAAVGYKDAHGVALSVTGSSKRERFDSYNRTVGEYYSTARALRKLAQELEHRANKEVAKDLPNAEERTAKSTHDWLRIRFVDKTDEYAENKKDEAAARTEVQAVLRRVAESDTATEERARLTTWSHTPKHAKKSKGKKKQ